MWIKWRRRDCPCASSVKVVKKAISFSGPSGRRITKEVLLGIREAAGGGTVFVTIAAGISIRLYRDQPQKELSGRTRHAQHPLLLGEGRPLCAVPTAFRMRILRRHYDFFLLRAVEILPEKSDEYGIAVNVAARLHLSFCKGWLDYAEQVGIDGKAALHLICKTLEEAPPCSKCRQHAG